MARVTVNESVAATTTVVRRRGPVLWRFVPLAFYLLAFTLVRGDLARGNVADLSLHLYFAAMGLYVGGTGQPRQQLPLSFAGEWETAAFLDPSTALVSRIRGASLEQERAVELVLVHLCVDDSAGCQVTTSVVSTTPGIWNTVVDSMVVLPPAV